MSVGCWTDRIHPNFYLVQPVVDGRACTSTRLDTVSVTEPRQNADLAQHAIATRRVLFLLWLPSACRKKKQEPNVPHKLLRVVEVMDLLHGRAWLSTQNGVWTAGHRTAGHCP